MLLCLSRLSLAGLFGGVDGWLLRADTTGMGRSWRRAGFYQVTKVSSCGNRARGGRRIVEGQHVCGSRLAGQAAPGACGSGAGSQVGVDLAGDVALQAADDLLLRQPFRSAPPDVGASGPVGAHPGDHDPPQGMVCFAVPAAVEPVPAGLPRGRGDRRDGAHMRPGSLTAQPLRVVPGRDQQQGGGVRADAAAAEQTRRADSDERDDQLVQPTDLGIEELHPPAELAQRDAEGVIGGITRAGPQGRDRLRQRASPFPGEPGPQIVGAGQDQGPGLG